VRLCPLRQGTCAREQLQRPWALLVGITGQGDGHQRIRLSGGIPRLAGKRECLIGHAKGARLLRRVHPPGARGEHPCPGGTWRLGWHQPQRFPQLIDAVRMAQAEFHQASLLHHQRRARGLGSGVDLRQRSAGKTDAAFILTGRRRGARRRFEDAEVAGADALRGIGQRRPEFEDPGQHGELLGIGQGTLSRARCLPGALQRPAGIVRRVPVVCLLDHRAARRDQGWISRQRLGQAGVQPGPRARQHLPEDRLADQRMPERIPISVGHQHVCRHRRPQRRKQRVGAEPGDRCEQRVPAPRPSHTQHLQ
jgi:hypothetical protein